jgi:hypothetical protein
MKLRLSFISHTGLPHAFKRISVWFKGTALSHSGAGMDICNGGNSGRQQVHYLHSSLMWLCYSVYVLWLGSWQRCFRTLAQGFILDWFKAVVSSTTAWGLAIRGPQKGLFYSFVSKFACKFLQCSICIFSVRLHVGWAPKFNFTLDL